jgi:hypothetical protein
MDKLFYYLVLCVDDFKDYMISDRRLGPGCMQGTPEEIPDSMGGRHRVLSVNPALRCNYDAHQRKLAQKARRA